jgi:hypothetical protein
MLRFANYDSCSNVYSPFVCSKRFSFFYARHSLSFQEGDALGLVLFSGPSFTPGLLWHADNELMLLAPIRL